jgi:hypothetical protein
MTTRKVLLRLTCVLALALSTLCYGAPPSALIVWDGTLGIETSVTDNLTTQLGAASFTVTANVGVPGGSLAGYQEIWDVRYDNTTPLSASDIAAYMGYLAGGGSLFVMGENTGFITRDNSIVSLVQSAGGGTLTLATASNNQMVQPPFTGPTAVSGITFLAAAGATSPPGRGAYTTLDSSNEGELVFGPGALSNAPAGSLLIVFDVNFLDPGSGYTQPGAAAFVANLIAYLAAPVPVIGPSQTPAPPSVVLMVIGLAGLGAWEMRRRAIRPDQADSRG